MIHPGLMSITFRHFTPLEIIEMVVKAGLKGIEWGGDIHVPPGNIERAGEVRKMSEDAGLIATSYGSYYEAGVSEGKGLAFERVLETAIALEVPVIRVWAGNLDSEEADDYYRERVVCDTQRISDMASRANINIAYEFHVDTLTDAKESALSLLKEVSRDNVKMYWQPLVGTSVNCCLEGLDALLPWLTNVHVFQWDNKENRCPLADGAEVWKGYLRKIASTGREHFAMIEYVKDDAPRNFYKDAETLKDWLCFI